MKPILFAVCVVLIAMGLFSIVHFVVSGNYDSGGYEECSDSDPNCFTFNLSGMHFSDVVELECLDPTISLSTASLICQIRDNPRFATTLYWWGGSSGAGHLIIRKDLQQAVYPKSPIRCKWESRDSGNTWILGGSNPFAKEACDANYRLSGYFPDGTKIPENVTAKQVRIYNWGW